MNMLKNFAVFSALLAFSSAALSAHHGGDHSDSDRLAMVLDSQEEKMKSRYTYRHPAETLEFFGLKPGMKIAELLPGGGWYTKILAPYVGEKGAIYGVNYADSMWAMFGRFDENTVAERVASSSKFAGMVAGFRGAEGVMAEGTAIGRIPEKLEGSLDMVFIIRGLHNLNRFEEKAGTMTEALKAVNSLLKPGGIAAVVQHRAPESAADTWANGSMGYLKQSYVISIFENAGFELTGSSEVNANPNDKPSSTDFVWRLPPSFSGAGDKDAAKKIGESDRMTLSFVKK
ncbi:MAG: putative methyltransferase [Gammaproteobacteria bacterium]|jgi:predicted methyltransferase